MLAEGPITRLRHGSIASEAKEQKGGTPPQFGCIRIEFGGPWFSLGVILQFHRQRTAILADTQLESNHW